MWILHRLCATLPTVLLSIMIWTPTDAQDSLALQRQLARFRNHFVMQGLPVEHYPFDDAVINAKLQETLIYDHKRQQKKLGAGILAGLGAVLVIGSAAVISGGNYNFYSSSSAAPILFMAGVTSSVVSIPLWISAGKSRKDLNNAIAEANALLLR